MFDNVRADLEHARVINGLPPGPLQLWVKTLLHPAAIRLQRAQDVTWTLAAPASEIFDLASERPRPTVEGNALTTELGPYEVRRLRLR